MTLAVNVALDPNTTNQPTNINQSAPNLVKNVYKHKILDEFYNGDNRTRIELSALELENLLCLHSSICKYRPISTKLGNNISAHKVSDEFDYGTNRTRTSGAVFTNHSLERSLSYSPEFSMY